ncbi:putative metal-dependent hydrolase [Paludibacter propionicigenes WB4]|uniref:Putative metal-dependent hydrolase n=1 Tax=Paludibacter propionicigenes (strain DSM 17365 / JCM 13257 / WB4) TaxID=694427 RepID=E4T8M5_PALPW|nr:MBL fold metallo-hydrolase [Paludibacter propionicigenes]ADQ81134.1 putative metal-dependent hydrolase [Paludibacter propionicigenes WB4]
MKLYKIEAGNFHVDGGAVFGVVPKKVWKKRYPCDDENYCSLSMRCLLIDTGLKRILIDTGTGDKQLNYLKYYGFKEVISFDTELARLGYTCADITDVVFTHLHFDHCGGTTRYNADKSAVELVFPNATHWVGATQWNNFLNPNVREGDSYFPENMLPVQEAGKLELVTENRFICPEVEIRIFNGHTVGQLVSYIHYGSQTLVYVGDVIPLAANVPLAWISAYDTDPLTAMEEKKTLLDEAAARHQILFFEHDTYTECCTIEAQYHKHKVGKTLRLEEISN